MLPDIIVKATEPLRLAEKCAIAPACGYESIGTCSSASRQNCGRPSPQVP